MSNENKKARKKLEKTYGKGCFLERMGIRTIKGIKKFDRTITFHHLKKKSKGGRATVDNGANLAWENHEWLHSLPEEEQEKINEEIKKWKLNFLLTNKENKNEKYGTLSFADLTKREKCFIISLEKTTKEQLEEIQKEENKKEKIRFDRNKIKRNTQKLINEVLYEESYEL